MYDPNLTFGSIPTTCFRSERPAFFHNGVKPVDMDEPLEAFLRKLTATVRNDRFTFMLDGRPIMAHPKWVRDHIGELRAFKHWEHDLRQYLELIAEHQAPEGFFYEMVQLPTDLHVETVDDSCKYYDQANNLYFIRLEMEADIEYLMVEGSLAVYQATGDEAWIRKMLPALERGIEYMITSPKRWDKEHGLVKRALTIDTWDFADGQPPENRMILPHAKMSIMHGDNSGVYAAMKTLAWLDTRFGYPERAAYWERHAAKLKENLDKYCWTGKFYQHMLHLGHDGVDGSDERERMSLSCAYDMNRGIMTFDQIQETLQEYRRRLEETECFAEWFSVNPPYESFGGVNHELYPKNIYVNGGLSSLVAGELAKAALENGQERYGWDVLSRLMRCVERDGELFFLYHPLTGQNLGGGPSGWSAAAIIAAIEEGLAGITDTDVLFRKMRFAPRWAVTQIREIKYITGYEESGVFVSSAYALHANRMELALWTPSEFVHCHILLPQACTHWEKILLNGKEIEAECVRINESVYADFDFCQPLTLQAANGYYPSLSENRVVIVFSDQ